MVDNVAYNDEGLPVITKEATFSDDSDKNVGTSSTKFQDEDAILCDKFITNSVRCHVILTKSKITFNPLTSPRSDTKKNSVTRKLSGLLRNSSKTNLNTSDSPVHTSARSEVQTINVRDIYSVKLLHKKITSSQDLSTGQSFGFVVHYAQQKINKLKQRSVTVHHTNDDTCNVWTNEITQIMKDERQRPRRVKVILQPHAGNKEARFQFRSKIEVLLQITNITYNLLDLQDKKDISHAFSDINLSDYDCLMCLGGDGTVSKVVNAVLNHTQKEAGQALRSGINPQTPHVTVAIVPFGTSNQIAMSVMGTDDPMTGALHAVLGHKVSCDILSVYCHDELIRWCFTAQYGFAANVVNLTQRYAFLGQNKVEAAIMKALTKAKLKEYKCDLEYVLSRESATSNTNDGVMCYSGCTVCNGNGADCMVEDLVEEFNPLAVSSTSSTIIDLSHESEWHNCKADYLNISLFTQSSRSQLAPQGQSKYTHLCDGCIDLIMVKQTPRKQFIRHLKRHGTSKNQLDFSFIDTRRVTQVRFRARLPITWNYKDYDYNEIDYEMSRVQSRVSRPSIDLVSVGSSDQHDSIDLDDVSEISDTESMTDNTPPPKNHATNDAPSSLPKPKLSFTEIEVKKRRDRLRKKDEKQKTDEENKSRSLWSLDSELVDETHLDFVVHRGLVLLCGLGVSSDTVDEDNVMRCLPL